MNIVCYGGGINSTAMLVGLLERDVFIDLILFADTGAEKPETYEHVERVSEWLRSVKRPPITIVRKESQYSSLEDECLRKKTLPSLAFGWRSCSDKWKQEPQRKFLDNWWATKEIWKVGLKATKFIGFDAGESRRAKPFDDPKYLTKYPLIEWGWYREDCIAAIKRTGLPAPIKSACFFCPASRKVEVAALKLEHPELYARAVAMEQNAAETLTVIKGLGRHWSWEALPEIALETVEQTCMCFDGYAILDAQPSTSEERKNNS